MAFLQAGRSQTEIADTLNRSKSTISREIRREGHKTKARSSADYTEVASTWVVTRIWKWLRPGWSPESISHRFSVEFDTEKGLKRADTTGKFHRQTCSLVLESSGQVDWRYFDYR
ncbi:helix-turn-helix domain-containing protein [Desulforhopalus vacuolatus]|nr:helix-turn-helix domain-containing protein [Desulforhopalus vacuolatus]